MTDGNLLVLLGTHCLGGFVTNIAPKRSEISTQTSEGVPLLWAFRLGPCSNNLLAAQEYRSSADLMDSDIGNTVSLCDLRNRFSPQLTPDLDSGVTRPHAPGGTYSTPSV